jgi:tripartite-type tricarboxylate transporter receptor subunit TctC
MRLITGAAVAVQILLCAAASAPAQEAYPTRTVQMVVPYPAGGTVDPLVRIICDRLSRNLGQSFVVINQPGAGGNTGTAGVIRGTHDGYTLVASAAALAINATYYRNLPFDAEKDLVPLAVIARFPMVFVAQPSLGVNSVPELVARAKAKPGSLSYGTSGNGTLDHLILEKFRTMAADMLRVPHNGVPATFTALLRGDVNFLVVGNNAALPFVEAKTVKPLAVTSAARSPQFPDVPTMEEQGFKNFQMYGWAMLYAPAGTPQPIVEKLHDEIARAVTDPAVRKLLTEQGAESPPLSLAQLRDYFHNEKELYGAIVRAADMKVE